MREEGQVRSAPEARRSGRETYYMVADNLTGPNLRWRDNLYQALAIGVCILLGTGGGAFLSEDRMVGAILGGVVGAALGLFVSGIFLMVYRGVQHARGKHG